MDECLFCGADIICQCRCLRNDSRCANGHDWHRCLEHPNVIVAAVSDHGKDGCSCHLGENFKLKAVPK